MDGIYKKLEISSLFQWISPDEYTLVTSGVCDSAPLADPVYFIAGWNLGGIIEGDELLLSRQYSLLKPVGGASEVLGGPRHTPKTLQTDHRFITAYGGNYLLILIYVKYT